MKQIFLTLFLTLIPYICSANQLIKAVENNSINQVETLLQSGIKPDTPGLNNITSLMKASLLNNTEMVNLLLKYKADPNKTNIAKTTSLHMAARKGNTDIIEILIGANANINAKDFSGYTPLMRAVSNSHYESVQTLLANKANLLVKNKQGYNVFDLTIEANKPMLMPLLTGNINYKHIKYLESLHQKTLSLQKKEMAEIINERISYLKQQKAETDTKYSLSITHLKDNNLTLKPLSRFPCLNNDVSNVTIKANICVDFPTKALINQTPVAKSRTFLTIGDQLQHQDIANIIPTEKTLPLSWKIESITPISKGSQAPKLASTPNYIIPVKYNPHTVKLVPHPKPGVIITAPKKPLPIAHISLSPKPIFMPATLSKNVPLMKPVIIDPFYEKLKETLLGLALNDPNFPYKKSIPNSPPNLGFDDVSSHVRIAHIRTKAWQIDTRRIPVSVIDYETLGPDLLYNRKYTIPYEKYEKKVPKPTFKEATYTYKTKAKKTPNTVVKQQVKQRKGVYIQIGTYANFDNAKRVSNKAKKFGNTFFSEGKLNNKKVLKVLIGPFPSVTKAKSVQSTPSFTNNFGTKTIIRKY